MNAGRRFNQPRPQRVVSCLAYSERMNYEIQKSKQIVENEFFFLQGMDIPIIVYLNAMFLPNGG